MRTTTAQKWGNSVAVRLPAKAAKRFGIREGAHVEVVEEEKTRSFSIRPVREPVYTLAGLLARITPKNRHDEAAWGSPHGKEAW